MKKAGSFMHKHRERPFTSYIKLAGGKYRIHIIPKGVGKDYGLKREVYTVMEDDIISFPEEG